MIVAIHQPNFFPWCGYFNKIARADTFVFLDNVQYTRGSYINRVKIINAGEPCWLTCPVKCCKGDLITNAEIVDTRWKSKAINTLKYNYQKTPFFKDTFDFIKDLILRDEKNLAEYNISNIIDLRDLLGLKTILKRQSGIPLPEGKRSTDLLAEIVMAMGYGAYMCGVGASQYQHDSILQDLGIDIIRQDISGFNDLSIIDCLFNNGIEGTMKVIGAR